MVKGKTFSGTLRLDEGRLEEDDDELGMMEMILKGLGMDLKGFLGLRAENDADDSERLRLVRVRGDEGRGGGGER